MLQRRWLCKAEGVVRFWQVYSESEEKLKLMFEDVLRDLGSWKETG